MTRSQPCKGLGGKAFWAEGTANATIQGQVQMCGLRGRKTKRKGISNVDSEAGAA